MSAHHKNRMYSDEYAVDPKPCIGCQHLKRCTEQREACYNYSSWLDSGKANGRKREPSVKIYQRIFQMR